MKVTIKQLAARNFREKYLTNVVEPINQTIFQNRPWIFQQDSAPTHKAKTMQQLLENHVPGFLVMTIGHQPSHTLIHLTTNYGPF